MATTQKWLHPENASPINRPKEGARTWADLAASKPSTKCYSKGINVQKEPSPPAWLAAESCHQALHYNANRFAPASRQKQAHTPTHTTPSGHSPVESCHRQIVHTTCRQHSTPPSTPLRRPPPACVAMCAPQWPCLLQHRAHQPHGSLADDAARLCGIASLHVARAGSGRHDYQPDGSFFAGRGGL